MRTAAGAHADANSDSYGNSDIHADANAYSYIYPDANGDAWTAPTQGAEEKGEWNHDDRSNRDDREDDAGWDSFKRPLHATDTERLTSKAVHEHPRPDGPPFFLRG